MISFICTMRKKIILLILPALMLTFCSNIFANQKHALLLHLNKKISVIKTAIANENSKRNILQNELAQTESLASQSTVKLQKNQHQLVHIQKNLMRLKQQQQATENKLNTQKDTLGKQFRIAYMMGRQSYFQLILDQQNISEFSRMLTYYKYITKQRLQTIHTIENLLATIQANKARIQNQYDALQLLGKKTRQQRQQLASTKKYRQALIKQINQQILSKQQRLAILIKNQQQLSHTVNHLENLEYNAALHGSFSSLKGRLRWPTAGKVLHTFGTIINRSELRWGGDLIKAKAGQAVHAIAAGKVIFAKWLSGYGLLLIINHGNGYMTLYGRNNTLYKKVGDLVKPGQLIATVGTSGGYQQPALYFAIRHNSKPLNPQRWCH